jgi:hypothetical protein
MKYYFLRQPLNNKQYYVLKTDTLRLPGPSFFRLGARNPSANKKAAFLPRKAALL